LIQHVTNHGGDHSITTYDERKVRTNSIHHQMINPYVMNNSKYKILAWTTAKISKTYLGPKDKCIQLPWDFKEIESIYYPEINAFGVQYHPEMMYGSKGFEEVINWTQNTFTKFFNNKL
jgi:gamma-glutamyl-gamma-aminobutyrate hydrolase PuuD